MRAPTEKNGSREEGVAGVKGSREEVGGEARQQCDSWLSPGVPDRRLVSRSVAWTEKALDRQVVALG